MKNLQEDISALLGLASKAHSEGEYKEAIKYCESALKIDASNVDIKELLAYALGNQGESQKALALLEDIIKSPKASAAALYEYGRQIMERGEIIKALNPLERAFELLPHSYEVLNDLGAIYAKLGMREEALEKLNSAIEVNGDAPEAYFNIGRLYDDCLELKKAIEFYQASVRAQDDFVNSWVNMAVDLNILKEPEFALLSFKKAANLNPDFEFLDGEIINTELHLAIWSDFFEKLSVLKKKIECGKRPTNPYSFLALTDDPGLQKKVAENFAEGRVEFQRDFLLKKKDDPKIRIAYFSADFRTHPVAQLIAELFELHDLSRFELFAFSLHAPKGDDLLRTRIKNTFDHFYEVENKTDQEIAQLARDLEIDIAIDLGGYTQLARTGIFASRAAPIQVNYLGYPGTMGASYMDYIVADPTLIPVSNQEFYSEKVAYLPDTYQPNDRKRQVASRVFSKSELGLADQEFIFCCFNNNFKINPDVFDSWARILAKVPGSILWLLEDNPSAKNNLITEMVKRDIASDRLVFAGRMPGSEHLARHALADLFLDTWPYNAHTTASDALWAGLPVLTLMGQTFTSRVAASLLNAIDLPELITNTREEYETLAVELAMHPKKLQAIKDRLNVNRLQAPLFDSELYTRHLEAAYLKMYERYQADLPPEHIFV